MLKSYILQNKIEREENTN